MADQGIQSKGISKSEETKSSATGGETVDNIDVIVSAEGGSLDANEEHTLSVSAGERKGGISSSETKTPATGGETVDNIDVVVSGESGSQNTNEEHIGPVVEQKSESTVLVVLGVVVLAVVVSIMVVNWAKLIYKKCYSDRMVLSVLIIFNIIGVIFVAILLYLRAKHGGFGNRRNRRKLTFLKIKLFSMYIFGICYLFHCGLYLWKHFSFLSMDECYVNSVLGILYNFITMMYTLLLFIYFANFYDRAVQNTFAENFMSLGILVSNACIWLDTIFSESNFLFKSEDDDDHLQILNVTQPTFEALKIIEKADPFLIPAMIEFSLMAVDLLFTKRNSSVNYFESSYLAADDLLRKQTQNTANTPPVTGLKSQESDNISVKLPCNYSKKQRLLEKCENPMRIVCLFIFFIFAFSLFAFTLTVVMINNKSEELLGHPEDFTVYATMQLIMKSTMLLLISICILVEWHSFTFHLNVSAFVLVFTCFGNVVYHVMYCFALDSEGHKNQSHTIHVSWAENIISIVLAGFQTMFILGTHSPKNYQNRRRYCMKLCKTLHQRFVFYFCCLLGVLNLGLWISDSIGEERLPVFSIAIYKAYDADVWSGQQNNFTSYDFFSISYWRRFFRIFLAPEKIPYLDRTKIHLIVKLKLSV